MNNTKNKKLFLPSLNGLRAICVIIVILHHINMHYTVFDGIRENIYLKPLFDLLTNGQLGVNMFFVISGFLITTLLLNEEQKTNTISLKGFYIRRTLRIFPAFYFMLFIFFILQIVGFLYISPISWMTALTYTKSYTMHMDWWLAHAWSLSIEEQFYLLWPLFFIAFPRYRSFISLFLFFIVPIFRTIFHFYPSEFTNEFTIFRRGDAIALGCFIALNKDKVLSIFGKNWNFYFFLSLFLLLILKYLPIIVDSNKWLVEHHAGIIFLPLGTTHGTIANILLSIILLYSIYGPRTIWHHFLNSKLMNYIGLLSYSLYLWQQLFLNNEYSENRFFILPLSILYLICASLLSYYFIEKPFLRLKSRYEM